MTVFKRSLRTLTKIVLLSLLCNTNLSAQPGLFERPQNLTCNAPERPPSIASVQWQELVNGINYGSNIVTHMVEDHLSRWFTLSRHGVIDIYDGNDGFSKISTAVNLTDRVTTTYQGTGSEFGALSMALDPEFASNGRIYLFYVAGPTQYEIRISRFTMFDTMTIDPNSEEILLNIPLSGPIHVGGTIAFGSDGYLYIATGDGGVYIAGGGGNSQDKFSLLGKFLRIDVRNAYPYSIPADNPYADGILGKPEIYAIGLRNPFRWSFDNATGDIWLGDVGADETEEINIIVKGGNYGWPILEGTTCWRRETCDTTGLIPPVYAYSHEPGSNAVIGGVLYNGEAIPELRGKYVFGDRYHSGLVSLTPGPQGLQREFLGNGNGYAHFMIGNDGEIYASRGTQLSKLVPSGPAPINNFPQLLSETGCFEEHDPTQPKSGLIPYSINSPLWSDGADKSRWMALPDEKTISVNSNGDFEFPVGTVLIKTFSLLDTLLETRLMVRHNDGEWAGYTYEWNNEQTDASLLAGAKTRSIAQGQEWRFPSRDQCLQCHTAASGRALGPEIAQLNKSHFYISTGMTANQLETLEFIGVLGSPLPGDSSMLDKLPSILDLDYSLDLRARAYLHSNCSMCHQPGGPGQGPEDFRYWIPGQSMGTYDVNPTQGNFDIPNARLIAPGAPESSILVHRMSTLATGRMPPLATNIIHQEAVSLISSWIASGLGFGFDDTDGDGVADNVDPDIDGDGIPNNWEGLYEFDPFDPTDAILDFDGDGRSNLEEFQDDTVPTDNQSFRKPVVVIPTVSIGWLILLFLVLVRLRLLRA